MKSIFIVARNTFKEVIRDRVLYGLIVFAVLVILLSLVLGQLSFYEQERISLNFGFSAIKISLVMLSIFIGSSLIYKEIEKKTVLTLIVRPISRTEFLYGKFLGLSGVLLILSLGLGATLMAVLQAYGFSFQVKYLLVLLSFFLESNLLLSVVFFFGVFIRPLLTVIFSLSIFLIGHGIESIIFFANKSKDQWFIYFSKICEKILPNLEKLNWSYFLSSDVNINHVLVLQNTLYALLWMIFLLSIAAIIFRKKDFV